MPAVEIAKSHRQSWKPKCCCCSKPPVAASSKKHPAQAKALMHPTAQRRLREAPGAQHTSGRDRKPRFAGAVADDVVELLVALTRRIPQAVKSQQEGIWGPAAVAGGVSWKERPR
jgi:hypothetical protein